MFLVELLFYLSFDKAVTKTPLSRGVRLGLGEGGSAEPGEAKTNNHKQKSPDQVRASLF